MLLCLLTKRYTRNSMSWNFGRGCGGCGIERQPQRARRRRLKRRLSVGGTDSINASTIGEHAVLSKSKPQLVAVHFVGIGKRDGFKGTDEASFLERLDCRVYLVEGSRENIKITFPEDLELAEFLLRQRDATPEEDPAPKNPADG